MSDDIVLVNGNVGRFKLDWLDNWDGEWSRARSEPTKFLCLKFWIWTTRFAFIFRNAFRLGEDYFSVRSSIFFSRITHKISFKIIILSLEIEETYFHLRSIFLSQ